MNQNRYTFKASKYYFMIFKNNKIVAYTDEERQVQLYMRYRNKLHYQVRIYKFIDLPDPIKEKIESGDWDKELVMVGSYGQCCMTLHDEIKFIDHMEQFRSMTPSLIYEMEYMLSLLKLSDKEHKQIARLFKDFYNFINEMIIDNNTCEEEIFSYEAFEKYLIKLGII